MATQLSYRGQGKHPTNPLWQAELALTKEWTVQQKGVPVAQREPWADVLLRRINTTLSSFHGEVKDVGRHIGAVQFQWKNPINSYLYYEPLNLAWVQFNTWDAFTKNPGTRTIRFGPDIGSVMVLVRSPKSTESDEYDWYLLARNKYQPAMQARFAEFSRGWDTEGHPNNIGWALFDRDFPGFKDENGEGADFVAGIRLIELGKSVPENTAEFINNITYHLIVVTLAKPMSAYELKGILVLNRKQREYENKPGYEDLTILDESDLTSEPMVLPIESAAKHLNGHLTKSEDARPTMLGENFSISCWARFLALYGSEFPDITPKTVSLAQLLQN